LSLNAELLLMLKCKLLYLYIYFSFRESLISEQKDFYKLGAVRKYVQNLVLDNALGYVK